jgi:hypothetical protein
MREQDEVEIGSESPQRREVLGHLLVGRLLLLLGRSLRERGLVRLVVGAAVEQDAGIVDGEEVRRRERVSRQRPDRDRHGSPARRDSALLASPRSAWWLYSSRLNGRSGISLAFFETTRKRGVCGSASLSSDSLATVTMGLTFSSLCTYTLPTRSRSSNRQLDPSRRRRDLDPPPPPGTHPLSLALTLRSARSRGSTSVTDSRISLFLLSAPARARPVDVAVTRAPRSLPRDATSLSLALDASCTRTPTRWAKPRALWMDSCKTPTHMPDRDRRDLRDAQSRTSSARRRCVS